MTRFRSLLPHLQQWPIGRHEVNACFWIALVRALEIVVTQEAVDVALDFLDADVPGLPAADAEAFIEQRSVHALDEAIGLRMAHATGAVIDLSRRPWWLRLEPERYVPELKASRLSEKYGSTSP
jgi:hypothetical protein